MKRYRNVHLNTEYMQDEAEDDDILFDDEMDYDEVEDMAADAAAEEVTEDVSEETAEVEEATETEE